MKKTVFIATSLISISAGFMYYVYQKCSKRIKWKVVGKVQHLFMYPLKSGRYYPIECAECTEFGLQLITSDTIELRDRCLVVYNEETKAFQTARNYSKLLLIETKCSENGLVLSCGAEKPFMLKIPTLLDSYEDHVIMWNGEKVFTIDCGHEAAQWISNILVGHSFGLRLGYHDGSRKRDIKKYHGRYIKMNPKLKYATSGLYSDLCTFLLLTKSSIDDVIRRIPSSDITLHNFRPNIVIESDNDVPYIEDNWIKIKIGDVTLNTTMPCSRCSITTINPTTLECNENFEPITTMKRYRKLTKYSSGITYPNLGIYMSLENPGKICVGDTVCIAEQ